MPAGLAIPLISGALGAVGGALNNRSKTSTSTSTMTPTWADEYKPLQTDMMSRLQARMLDPAAGTEPIRLGLLEGVNQRYRGLPNRVSTALAKRGFANSGQMGGALKGLELARSGEMNNVNTSMASNILDRENQTMALINQLLGMTRGTETKGTQTTPGNMLGGAFSGGLQGFGAGMGMSGLGGGGFDASTAGPTVSANFMAGSPNNTSIWDYSGAGTNPFFR